MKHWYSGHNTALAVFLAATAIFIGTATSTSDVQSETAKAEIPQIRNTLHNLLRSIDDAGRESETLFGKRKQWCQSTLHAFELSNQVASSSIEDMEAQITEAQAEVEETEGTVQQIKVQIEMDQHTMKQTKEMLEQHRAQGVDDASNIELIHSLVENKQLSCTSLESQLDITVPVLSQLQADVAEAKQRVSYRKDSVEMGDNFITALKDGCKAADDRADAQAAARVGETNSIRAALQGLDEIAAIGRDEDQQVYPPSFLQVGDQSQDLSSDDLTDLFAMQQGLSAVTTERASNQERRKREVATGPILRPRIQTLLAQLKNSSSGLVDQDAWCKKQRINSELTLKFAQDSLSQVSSQVEAHADAEAEVSEELKSLQASASEVRDAIDKALKQANEEQEFVKRGRKDQALAGKILEQAMTIIKELKAPASIAKVLGGLESAHKMFLGQMSAGVNFEKEAYLKAMSIRSTGEDLGSAKESEQHNLELSQDDHASSRLRAEETKRLLKADVLEATTYKQKLEESCTANIIAARTKKQYSAQVLALEDADKALQGKLTASASTNLRGREASTQVKPAKDLSQLTPLQRAAMEMGVSVDE